MHTEQLFPCCQHYLIFIIVTIFMNPMTFFWVKNSAWDHKFRNSSRCQDASFSVQHVCTSPWTQILFQSMYLLAFFAFIRVGEMTLSHGRTQNVLHLCNILFEPSVKGMYITFQHYKHSKGQPHTILIRERPGEHCPVGCLRHYLAYRDTSPGPLFILPSGHPVSSALFTSTMNKCLHFIGINASLYKAHSFRIGAASQAAKMACLMHKLDIWLEEI